jgi:hypothetical protein
MIGTTRSRISHLMNRFRKLGLSYNGQIEVHSSMLNAVLQEKPHLRMLALTTAPLNAAEAGVGAASYASGIQK